MTDGADGESSGQAPLLGTATPAEIYEGSYFFEYGPAYGLRPADADDPPRAGASRRRP